MAATFDAATREILATTDEIGIRTSKQPEQSVIIWVVVVDDAVFVRSFRGKRGKWYDAAVADRKAVLQVGDALLPVTVIPVADAAAIEAVSRAFLAKYAASPYAKEMVRPETLSTTLRLDPA